MNIVVNDEPRIVAFKVTSNSLIADLADGRRISAPLAWSWRLSDAKPEQRNNFEIMGNGQGVHWPELDEDISAQGLLHGIPARRPRKTAALCTTSFGNTPPSAILHIAEFMTHGLR